MSTFRAFLRALGDGHTYDLRRNLLLWLGAASGLLVPVLTLALDVDLLGRDDRGVLAALREHPTHLALLFYPAFLGILFGAMGTVRRDLELENRRLMDVLKTEAVTDPLTGLYNRRYIQEVLRTLVGSARRWRKPFSVILVDLDGFKSINDHFGHPGGDRVLCQAAAALKSSLRDSDVLGRHGGDEFILLNPGTRASADGLAKRALDAVHGEIGLTLSSGVATWPEDGESAEQLIDAADSRLGASKRRSHEARGLTGAWA